MAVEIKTSCPLNCWDNCGFVVTVEGGTVKKVEGDPDHPITKGKICGRGRMLEGRTNSDLRLLHPLKKVNGQFKEITWDIALDEIAEKLINIRDSGQTTSVLHSHDYSNSGLLTMLEQRFFNCYGGVTELTGSLCWGAGIEAQFSDFGNAHSHSPKDLINSQNIVVWGRNVATTNMHLYNELIEAKKKGTKIIVVDPMYNRTAKLADTFICVKAGMDSFLALGVMKEIYQRGLQDQHFINNHSIGFNHVIDLLESISFEEIIETAGISYQDIVQLADCYIARPTATLYGLGLQRYKNGGNTIRTIDALVAMSGNVGIPGGGANFGNLQVGQSFDGPALTLLKKRKNHRLFTRMEQAEQILTADDPEIKLGFVTRHNPVTQVGDTNRVVKAYESLETLVVVDQFMTDTAKLADYVLPCTTVFENEDIYYSSMFHQYVNYGPRLVEPRGNAKSDTWIWTELAKRLGFAEDFNYSTDEFIKIGLGKLEDQGVTLEKLKEENRAALPIKDVPWNDLVFQTPSGKYEFVSQREKDKGGNGKLTLAYPEESEQNNPDLAKRFPYRLLSIHPLRSNHSQHYQLIKGIQTQKVEISDDIAREHQLKDGDIVEVYNDRGSVSGQVKILNHAHQKTINIEEGLWLEFGGTVNMLTSSHASDNGLGSTLYDCLVQIKKQ